MLKCPKNHDGQNTVSLRYQSHCSCTDQHPLVSFISCSICSPRVSPYGPPALGQRTDRLIPSMDPQAAKSSSVMLNMVRVKQYLHHTGYIWFRMCFCVPMPSSSSFIFTLWAFGLRALLLEKLASHWGTMSRLATHSVTHLIPAQPMMCPTPGKAKWYATHRELIEVHSDLFICLIISICIHLHSDDYVKPLYERMVSHASGGKCCSNCCCDISREKKMSTYVTALER